MAACSDECHGRIADIVMKFTAMPEKNNATDLASTIIRLLIAILHKCPRGRANPLLLRTCVIAILEKQRLRAEVMPCTVLDEAAMAEQKIQTSHALNDQLSSCISKATMVLEYALWRVVH